MHRTPILIIIAEQLRRRQMWICCLGFWRFRGSKSMKSWQQRTWKHIYSLLLATIFETWIIMIVDLIDAKNAENPPTTKLMLCAIESGECLKNNETMIVCLKPFFLKKKKKKKKTINGNFCLLITSLERTLTAPQLTYAAAI